VENPVHLGVTLQQAALVLSRLERRDVTPSQVRTMLVLGADARAQKPNKRGDPRQFAAVDLALGRILLRLRHAGVSPVVSRVIVATLRESTDPSMPSLVDHLRRGDRMALAVHGMRGWLVYDKQRPAAAVAWVPLCEVMQGLESTMRAVVREAGPSLRAQRVAASARETLEAR
jgi:hypothetical protein